MADHQKYRITSRVDAGGMAEVFRGVAESLQGFKKNVAIKRILPHLTKNSKFISMFLDEARLSLHLQHANIVGVFDIGVSPAATDGSGGAYFIVMEFVDGTHLKGIVESLRRQGKKLTVAQVLYIMMQVCSGLSYAHDVTDPETGRPLGIVHRDISPPNILISKNGEVKLVDFGLAKATSQLESTDPGVVKGKFSYLSPEAASGKEVDRRADIFAVGILMYELLTGKRLFYGETDYQTVELVRQARVPSMGQQNADVDDELESIVRRALARDVNARFQTAGELQDSIAQYLFGKGLKVTSRDIATLVQSCVAERAKAQPAPAQQKSLIDTLILEELNKFTSLEETSGASDLGAQPLSPDDISGVHAEKSADARGGGGDLVDTSSWISELTGEGPSGLSTSGGRSLLDDGGDAAGRNGSQARSGSRGSKSGATPTPSPSGIPTGSRTPSSNPPQGPSSAMGTKGSNARPSAHRSPPPSPIGAGTSPATRRSEDVESLADLLEGEGRARAASGRANEAHPRFPTPPPHAAATAAGSPAQFGSQNRVDVNPGAETAGSARKSPTAMLLAIGLVLLLVGGGAILLLVRAR